VALVVREAAEVTAVPPFFLLLMREVREASVVGSRQTQHLLAISSSPVLVTAAQEATQIPPPVLTHVAEVGVLVMLVVGEVGVDQLAYLIGLVVAEVEARPTYYCR
jgi:hypothetical protein